MLPEIRDIILADERIKKAGFVGQLRMEGFKTIWERGGVFVGDPSILDKYEEYWSRTLSALCLRMEFPTPEGRFVQIVVALPEYLIHGVDDHGNRRRG